MTRRRVAILGSTGSIGTTALRVLARQPDRFEVTALTAHANAARLRRQVDAVHPAFVGLVTDGTGVDAEASWCRGAACLTQAAVRDDVDVVVDAVTAEHLVGLDVPCCLPERTFHELTVLLGQMLAKVQQGKATESEHVLIPMALHKTVPT